jgi:hypothetical protein
VLELVIGEVAVGLAVVSLGDEIEKRLPGVVVRQPLVGHLPADRLAREQRREAVPEPGAVGPVAADAADLLATVRVRQPEPVAGRPRERARTLAHDVELVDEPVATADVHDGSRLQFLVGHPRVATVGAGAAGHDDLVALRAHATARRPRGVRSKRTSISPSASSSDAWSHGGEASDVATKSASRRIPSSDAATISS